MEQLRAGHELSAENNLNLTFLSKTDQEVFRTQGFQTAIGEILEGLGEAPNPWVRWQTDPIPRLDELVVVDFGSDMIFDRHGKVLPVALNFNYINSGIDESSYDLRGVFECLKKRDDVRILMGNPKSSELEKEPECFEEALSTIPYYNSEEGRTQSIHFVVFKNKLTDTRQRGVMNSDILGLSKYEIK